LSITKRLKKGKGPRAGFTQTRRALFIKMWGPPRASAGIFARGGTRGSGGGSPPAVSRGWALVGVWGQSPQKLMEYCLKWHTQTSLSSCGGPIFVGAPVRPNMLNMPKSASERSCIAVNGTLFHSYGVSLAIWDHTVLPFTRHKWTIYYSFV